MRETGIVGALAQLAEATDLRSAGSEFESRRPHMAQWWNWQTRPIQDRNSLGSSPNWAIGGRMTLPCEGYLPYVVLGKLIEFSYSGEWSFDEGWVDVEYTLSVFRHCGMDVVGFRDILGEKVVADLDNMVMANEKRKRATA